MKISERKNLFVVIASFFAICIFLCVATSIIGNLLPKRPTPTSGVPTSTPTALPTSTIAMTATNDNDVSKFLDCRDGRNGENKGEMYSGLCLADPIIAIDRVKLELAARQTCEKVTVTVLCSLWIWDDAQYVPAKLGDQTDEQVDALISRFDVGPFKNTDCFTYYKGLEIKYSSPGC